MKYNQEMEVVENPAVYKALSSAPDQFIMSEEKAYHDKISHICNVAINEHRHIILITGPSASGKTTSAQRVADLLEEQGKKVNRISLDNFYKPARELPRWEDGYQNYESIDGLDIPLFDDVMNDLLKKGRSWFPIFNFVDGTREDHGEELIYDGNNTYLILEGIHALNPLLSNTIKNYDTLRIYISVHSNIVDESGNTLLTARDLRLCRRLLRDYLYRGTSAQGTLEMWNYVVRGEDLYIRPFRRYADIHVNSTHRYEPYLYREDLNMLMSQINKKSPYRLLANHILEINKNFFPISYSDIPQNSLIQEFIKLAHNDGNIPIKQRS